MSSMSDKYPKYYKPVPKNVDSLDVYAVCQMFPVDDATGCINHARKKLLVPGTRTGGKSMIDDIREARDTLNRYLELHESGNVDQKRIKDKLITDTAAHAVNSYQIQANILTDHLSRVEQCLGVQPKTFEQRILLSPEEIKPK